MALDLGLVEAVRAAEAGSDIGGDTIMVPADVTSSNAGPVEVERLGEVDELAAEAQDLSSRGSDGGENSSSQPIGGRAREAHFFSLPVAENSEPPVAAALDAGAVLEAPATREQQLAALPSEQELGERAASMFIVGADDPASSGMPPAVQVVTKELVLRAWEVMTTLCKKAGKELSQSFGNFDKVMGLGWLLGDVVLGYLISAGTTPSTLGARLASWQPA